MISWFNHNQSVLYSVIDTVVNRYNTSEYHFTWFCFNKTDFDSTKLKSEFRQTNFNCSFKSFYHLCWPNLYNLKPILQLNHMLMNWTFCALIQLFSIVVKAVFVSTKLHFVRDESLLKYVLKLILYAMTSCVAKILLVW